jgi:hypothetical protein
LVLGDNQWIGLRENLNRKPSIFPVNIRGFPVNFPIYQSIEIRLVGVFFETNVCFTLE